MFRLGGAVCCGLVRRVCFAMPQEMIAFLKCLSGEFLSEERCKMKSEHRIACWYYGQGKQYVPAIPEGERFLPDRFQKGLATVVGAGLGNATSDFMGGASTLSWDLATGTALGCLIGLVFIPTLYYIGKLRRIYKDKL